MGNWDFPSVFQFFPDVDKTAAAEIVRLLPHVDSRYLTT